MYLCIYQSTFLSIYLFVYLYISLPIYICIYHSINLSINSSTNLYLIFKSALSITSLSTLRYDREIFLLRLRQTTCHYRLGREKLLHSPAKKVGYIAKGVFGKSVHFFNYYYLLLKKSLFK